MKAWYVRPYWTKRDRLINQIRIFRWEELRDNKVNVKDIDKTMKIISDLSKRLPE